jgi:hypothetical protein
MTWQKPEYIEINMSAEIGGYQDDFEERAPVGPDALTQARTDSQSHEG